MFRQIFVEDVEFSEFGKEESFIKCSELFVKARETKSVGREGTAEFFMPSSALSEVSEAAGLGSE